MTQDDVLNTVVLLIVIGALVVGLLSMLIGKIVDAWDVFAAWWGAGVQKAIHTRPSDMSSRRVWISSYEDEEPDEPRSSEFPLLNGVEPQLERSVNPPELALNAAEMAAIQRMIVHNKTAAKPSKSSTIHAGFGVSRGGSAAYIRASLIYDTLFVPPAPTVRYVQRTPEQDALRDQLGIARP